MLLRETRSECAILRAFGTNRVPSCFTLVMDPMAYGRDWQQSPA